MKCFAVYLTLFKILVPAQSALDTSQMNGSKGQVDHRMTPPSKVREAVNMLKNREMWKCWKNVLTGTAWTSAKRIAKSQCWRTNNSYTPVWAGCGLARKQHCREGVGIAHGKLVVLMASHLLGWLVARG